MLFFPIIAQNNHTDLSHSQSKSFWELIMLVISLISRHVGYQVGGKRPVSKWWITHSKRHSTHKAVLSVALVFAKVRSLTLSESATRSLISDLVKLLFSLTAWTSHLSVCSYRFVWVYVFVGTTCSYGCGCLRFACLLAMNADRMHAQACLTPFLLPLLSPTTTPPLPSPHTYHQPGNDIIRDLGNKKKVTTFVPCQT